MFVGPNVYNISSEVPEGCTVEQAAYVTRHGSRYPDTGAYAQWVALYEKVCLFEVPTQFICAKEKQR